MIDPVNLVLVDKLEPLPVERSRRGKIGPERLLPPPPPPRAILRQHAGAAEFPADREEAVGRGRQIEQPVAAGFPRGLQSVELLAHRIERRRVFRIGLDASDACQQVSGEGVVYLAGGKLVETFDQAVGQFLARHGLAGDADDAEIVRQKIVGCKVIERRDHQPVCEIAGHAEDDNGAGIGLFLFCFTDGHFVSAFEPDCFGGSLWPPKPARIAERIFSAKVCSLRERKRANNAAVSTSAGTASSMAAFTVQRPSPESSTNPEKFDSVAFSASAAAVRSSSQEETTLPWRQTSAISARSKL